jgi:hypothetical protein
MKALKKTVEKSPVGRKKKAARATEDVEVEQKDPVEASPAKPGRKRRTLTLEERVERLEGLHATLVVKLRPHGIHLQAPDDTEDAAAE